MTQRLNMIPRRQVLIVLDLNGTLIDRVDQKGRKLLKNNHLAPSKPDHVLNKNYVYMRPYLDSFLDSVFARFHVAAWTSALQKNAEPLADLVFGEYASKLEFVWDRSKCDFPKESSANDYGTLKDLRKVWDDRAFNKKWAPGNTIIVDDTSSKGSLNKNNALTLPTYMVTSPPHIFNSDNDTTLLSVLMYLERLADAAPQKLDDNLRKWDVRDYLRANQLFREEERKDTISMTTFSRLAPVGEYAVKTDDIDRLLSREPKRTRFREGRAPPFVRSEWIGDQEDFKKVKKERFDDGVLGIPRKFGRGRDPSNDSEQSSDEEQIRRRASMLFDSEKKGRRDGNEGGSSPATGGSSGPVRTTSKGKLAKDVDHTSTSSSSSASPNANYVTNDDDLLDEQVNSFLTEIRSVEYKFGEDSMRLDLPDQRVHFIARNSPSEMVTKSEQLGMDEERWEKSLKADFPDYDYIEEVAVFKEEKFDDVAYEYGGWRLHPSAQKVLDNCERLQQQKLAKAGESTPLTKKQRKRLAKESAVASGTKASAKHAGKKINPNLQASRDGSGLPLTHKQRNLLLKVARAATATNDSPSHVRPPTTAALMNLPPPASPSVSHIVPNARPPTNAVAASPSSQLVRGTQPSHGVAGVNPAARPPVHHNRTWYANPNYPKPSGTYYAQPYGYQPAYGAQGDWSNWGQWGQGYATQPHAGAGYHAGAQWSSTQWSNRQ
ncbi:hypothetical protein BJ742DRAFT_772080 [Cladochytrium replicatum]|nr:hypothetical protein BJ742DRAFT_772080 [Cladochytrium replicatum]